MISKIKSLVADYKVLLRNVPALVTVIFCVGTCWMNVAAGKIIFNAWNVAVTGGFLISFLPFLCLDVVAKRFGARAAIMLNILSAVSNTFFVLGLSLVAAIPTDADYSAFNSVLGGVWFITLSSIVAFVVSGIINSLLNSAIGKLFKKTSGIEFATRSFISTFVGQALDNFIFIAGVYVLFAPKFWGLPALPILTCVGTAVLGGFFELLCEVVTAPIGYKIVKNWERDNVGHEYIDLHSEDIAA